MQNILSIGGVTALLVIAVTLILQFAPGIRVKWGGLPSNAKKGIIVLLYVLGGAVVAFGGCVAFIASIFPQLLCVDAPTFVGYLASLLVAVAGGQGFFNLLPELDDVEEAKALRY